MDTKDLLLGAECSPVEVLESLGWKDAYDELKEMASQHDLVAHTSGAIDRGRISLENREVCDVMLAGAGRHLLHRVMVESDHRHAITGYADDGSFGRSATRLVCQGYGSSAVVTALAIDAPKMHNMLRSICGLTSPPLVWARSYEELCDRNPSSLKTEVISVMSTANLRRAVDAYMERQMLVMRVNSIGVCVTSQAVDLSEVGAGLIDSYSLTWEYLEK